MISDVEWDKIQKKLDLLYHLEEAGVEDWEGYPHWLDEEDEEKDEEELDDVEVL